MYMWYVYTDTHTYIYTVYTHTPSSKCVCVSIYIYIHTHYMILFLDRPPPGIPLYFGLYFVFCAVLVLFGLSTHAMHILTLYSLPIAYLRHICNLHLALIQPADCPLQQFHTILVLTISILFFTLTVKVFYCLLLPICHIFIPAPYILSYTILCLHTVIYTIYILFVCYLCAIYAPVTYNIYIYIRIYIYIHIYIYILCIYIYTVYIYAHNLYNIYMYYLYTTYRCPYISISSFDYIHIPIYYHQPPPTRRGGRGSHVLTYPFTDIYVYTALFSADATHKQKPDGNQMETDVCGPEHNLQLTGWKWCIVRVKTGCKWHALQ